MAKGQSNVKPKKNAGYMEDSKNGKVKKGRMVDGQVVFDTDDETEDDDDSDDDDSDDDDEDGPTEDELDEIEEDSDDEDDEPTPPKKLTKREQAAKDMQASIDKKKDKKKDDEPVKIRPSMVQALPPEKRKVAAEKITAKSTVVTVKDLEEESGLDGKKLRRIIRGLGYKAPETDLDSGEFGARKKYTWDSKSPVLKEIRAAIKVELED